MDVDWLKAALKASHKTKSGLAAALGVDPSVISRILSGERKVKEHEELAIYQFLDTRPAADIQPEPIEDNNSQIETLGRVAMNVWVTPSASGYLDPSPFPPDPRFPLAKQFDMIVDGHSHEPVAHDGERVRCLAWDVAHGSVRDGQLVVVELRRQELAQYTIRRVFKATGHIRLDAVSHDPALQAPLYSNDQAVRILGLVQYLYRRLT